MGMVEQLGGYITSGGIATLGESTAASTGLDGARMFYHTLVDSTSVTIALLEPLGGAAPSRTYGRSIPAMERPRLRVLTRSTAPAVGASLADPSKAKRTIRRVYARLEGIANTTVSGSTYYRVEAPQPPWQHDRDQAGRIIFACDFIVTRAPSSTGG